MINTILIIVEVIYAPSASVVEIPEMWSQAIKM